jgi:hypothetical protein
MNLKVTEYRAEILRKDPRDAFKLLAASKAAKPLRNAATNPKVHKEAKKAAAEASKAAARAQKLGPAKALNDKRVTKGLQKASKHSRNALVAANPAKGRPIKKATGVVLGAGVLGGASYAGWKKFSSKPEPAPVEPVDAAQNGHPDPASAEAI